MLLVVVTDVVVRLVEQWSIVHVSYCHVVHHWMWLGVLLLQPQMVVIVVNFRAQPHLSPGVRLLPFCRIPPLTSVTLETPKSRRDPRWVHCSRGLPD